MAYQILRKEGLVRSLILREEKKKKREVKDESQGTGPIILKLFTTFQLTKKANL